MIEDAHKKIRDAVRKSLGSYVTPSQIDRALNAAVSDLFEGLLQPGLNTSSQQLSWYLSEAEMNYTNSSRYDLPEDLVREVSVSSAADGTLYEGDILSEQEFLDRRNSRLVGPTTEKPIARIVGGEIEILPLVGNYILSYYREPKECRFAYTSPNGRDIVFDEENSIDIDCNSVALSSVISRALLYLGVGLESPSLTSEESLKNANT